MLQLVEAPIEDKTMIAYTTEDVQCTLASLEEQRSKELLPDEVELKCLLLELIEVVNFLHTSSKQIHLNLAPEHIYIARDGRLKLAGLTFTKAFTSADPVAIQLETLCLPGNQHLNPNMRFAAPEVSSPNGLVSAQADIFSIGCLIYFLVALNRGMRDVYLLQPQNTTSTHSHQQELSGFQQKLAPRL